MNFDDMVNIECLCLSHNLLKDITSIGTMTTLVELNLNFNLISDIMALEEMTNLEKLYLAHNKIADITPIANLKRLDTVDFTNNDIFYEESTLNTLYQLPKLKDLSISKNPVYSKEGFKHHLVLKLRLQTLEYEKITDLDKDIARMFYKQSGLSLPEPKKQQVRVQRSAKPSEENEESSYPSSNKENKNLKSRLKKVKFDDQESTLTNGQLELRKLHKRISKLTEENEQLKLQLTEKNYEFTYKENQIMKIELNNMYILEEENKDLKKDLDKYRKMELEGEIGNYMDGKLIPESEKVKALKSENEMLNIRIGELLERLYKVEQKTEEIETRATKNSAQEIDQKIILSKMYDGPLERPQTAQAESGYDPLLSKIEEELDLDIQKMLERNKKQLSELKHEMEEVKNMRPPRKRA
uniref:Uncharacterized protein n=1 Tax=Euplotes crassus TaxID=5936 RepID=A0A7S3KCS3_EUPCR|mmetsp:Transcript_19173/g.18818  ORF Transcript_19173/g.18818 Transcript_19173/m.18818 type:complete len:412 (+) Transcript_19173:760-1995(+)|eukprot:CAMPEP_0197001686 /NCGR_PEP_ID=MMETSP1380-20130617/6330_1 /TAXON_ID=5936 /ORGANISM="Euplotes crassus, Strain CT5" /LENGTH=411 /DNA_ID=CAMNT_0042419453 /DNA_START=314 /DNA_END=1549 /DNA_ORIENTATION=-